MTTFANSPSSMHDADTRVAMLLGRCFAVQWTSTRRASQPNATGVLERVACVLEVTLIDLHHAAIECWLEVDGACRRKVLSTTARPCRIAFDGNLLHIDVQDHNAQPVVAISLDPEREQLGYARCAMLCEAGLRGGTYDPPTMRRAVARSIAQSA